MKANSGKRASSKFSPTAIEWLKQFRGDLTDYAVVKVIRQASKSLENRAGMPWERCEAKEKVG